MRRFLLPLAVLTAGAAFAQSDDQAERFAAALDAMEARTFAFYVSADPRFEPFLTPAENQTDFLTNQACFLERIDADGRTELVQDYIAAMETMGTTPIVSLIELSQRVPPVLSSEVVMAASAECGSLTQSTSQMMTPEFQALMADPDVVKKLMGE